MRRITAFILPFVLVAAWASGALGQATQSFSPTALPLSVSASTSSGTTRLPFPSPGPTALIINTSTSVPAYVNMGSATVTATTSSYLLGPGCSVAYNISGKPYVAAITGSSTTTLQVWTGNGLPTLQPSTCYLPVSFSGAFNLAQVNGTTTSVGTGVTDGGSQRVTVSRDATTIAGAAPGTAGTASANVVTVQGIGGGTAVPVSVAALPLPSGGATAALQTSVQGSPSGGAAATASQLTGGIYNSVNPTLTNGQQASAQLTATGALRTDGSGVTQGVNVAQVNGVTVLTGSGATGTGSQRVTVAVDSATVGGSASIPAGTNVIGHVINDAGAAIIGKVGIDQTTPGTTNAVSATNFPTTVSVNTGATGASSPRVTVAVDSATVAGSAALPAGSAIIGKTGTDQTTPGTTDLVTTRYSRPNFITKAVTLGTTYAVGQDMGGLLTITGLVAGATYRLSNMTMTLAGTLTATSSIIAFIFNANPSASTFTDTNAAVINTADTAKVVRIIGGSISAAGTVGGYAFVVQTVGPAITADGSGQIYMGLVAGGTFTLTSPVSSIYLEFDN